MTNNHFVFDTNALISALLFEHSTPTFAYEKAKRLGKLTASSATFAELSEVLLRRKFDRYLSLATRISFLESARTEFSFHTIFETITVCRDPKDNKFLELALAANAACIVSGDEDLLVLHPFRNIPILNAADFLVHF